MADQTPATLDPTEDDIGDESPGGGASCLLVSAGSFASGGMVGGLFGLAGGVFKRQGLKTAWQEGLASAKTFAVMSGVHSLVICCLQNIRKKDDVINQGLAGCASGIALGLGGPPSVMLQNCAGFAAFAYIYELLAARTAVAGTLTGPSSAVRRPRRQQRRQQCCKPIPDLIPFSCQVSSWYTDRLPALSLALPCWLSAPSGCSLQAPGSRQ